MMNAQRLAVEHYLICHFAIPSHSLRYTCLATLTRQLLRLRPTPKACGLRGKAPGSRVNGLWPVEGSIS